MLNKEEELMQACKNCDLEKVKSLVKANKYDSNILKKAKSVAQDVSCSEVIDYLENINRGNNIIEDCRNALNRGNPDSKMYPGKSNFRIDSNTPDNDDDDDDNNDSDSNINKQI